MTIQFQEFDKIPRYRREMTVTEKIDGTNAAVVWFPAHEPHPDILGTYDLHDQHGNMIGPYHLLAQSRTRFCVPETMRKGGDNHGFGAWVQGHMVELAKLGPGVHYGEWWGHGIQRKYGLDHKRFSLFNVTRWAHNPNRPECCHVVPILALGKPEDGVVESAIDQLRRLGSQAAPGFMDPEGVIVFHSAANKYFKVMLKNDDEPKSLSYEKLLAFQRGQIECA